MPRPAESYSTQDELAFLAHLSRERLRDYLAALPLRQDWGRIDRVEVERWAWERWAWFRASGMARS